MKKIISLILLLAFILSALLNLFSCVGPGGGLPPTNLCKDGHIDKNNDDYCDFCRNYVIVEIDFYALNDLHGKFCNTDRQKGVYTLASYLKLQQISEENVVILSSGDMWQGTAESNLSHGNIITEWMNDIGVVSMTIGNHEFDWGEEVIKSNLEIADFPFLAINIYDTDTGKLAEYCTPSVVVECGDVQVGIIGAIGDCYSSISADMVEGVKFKVGSELTALVKAESERLRAEGADIIVYSLHDGYGKSKSDVANVNPYDIKSYYDTVLSSGYVDLVFEAHTHQSYVLIDSKGVYHLQGGGENAGISYVELAVNSANGKYRVNKSKYIKCEEYDNIHDDEDTLALEEKYSSIIDAAFEPIGSVSRYYDDSTLEDVVAELYLDAGIEKWGDQYNVVLGGGFLKTRKPYNLTSGQKNYADILSLLPFDNRLVLCSVSGYNLKYKFLETSNADYHIELSDYGNSLGSYINYYDTYYIVVDTYTAFYAPNGLTIIDFYDDTTYARDLVAEAIKNGEI